MSHNIDTGRNVSNNTPGQGDTIPVTEPGWVAPVLTIANPGYSRTRRKPMNILFRTDGIVFNPWSADGDVIEVTREDLFALRELLAEIPEEAFVRPADPVREVYTVKDANGDWWASFDPELKTRFSYVFNGTAEAPTNREVSDHWGTTFDILVDAYGIDGGPAPFWTDGDTIVYAGRNVHTVYERKAGVWHRVATGGNGGPLGPTSRSEYDDAHFEKRANRNNNWSVLKRANA